METVATSKGAGCHPIQNPQTIARELSEENANASVKALRDLPITQEAARFKSQNRMSYSVCYAAALAKIRKADLVTGDGEFKPLDDEIKIAWL
jgi:hypothetical protein